MLGRLDCINKRMVFGSREVEQDMVSSIPMQRAVAVMGNLRYLFIIRLFNYIFCFRFYVKKRALKQIDQIDGRACGQQAYAVVLSCPASAMHATEQIGRAS